MENYIYLILYLPIIVGALYNAQPQRHKIPEKYIVALFLFVYILLFTLRDLSVGFDTRNYEVIFEMIKNNRLTNYILGVEKGYLVINYITSICGLSFRGFLFCVGLFFVVSIYFLIDKHKDSKLLILFLFYSAGPLFNMMNQIRAAIAALICLVAIYLAIERKIRLSVFLIVIALTFHSSAIIGLIAVFLIYRKIRIDLKNVGILFVVAIISFFSANILVNIVLKIFPKYLVYFAEDKARIFIKEGNITYLLYFMAIILFALYQRNKAVHCGVSISIMYEGMFWTTSLGVIISFLVLKLSLIQRFMVLPLYSSPLLVAQAINLEKTPKKRLQKIIIIGGLYIIYCYFYLYISEGGYGRDGVVPYKLS